MKKSVRTAPKAQSASRHWTLFFCIALLAGIGLIYGQTLRFSFVNYDDPEYIYRNLIVQQGLTWNSIRWAFTTPAIANWHPLTWVSHLIDIELYGLWPGGHHLTNILFHAANSILLFFVLRQMTGAAGPSAFVVALFALHPLRVESVAWVAERKDVLSGLFWILAMGAYTRYVKTSLKRWYFAVALLLAIGLMCKPTAVTFPLVLLLLDYWPLGRCTFGPDSPAPYMRGVAKTSTLGLILEKLPLLGLAVISSVVTMIVQRQGGAMSSFQHAPPLVRILNSLSAYMRYIFKTIYPVDLAVLYPFHYSDIVPPIVLASISATIILVSIILLIRYSRRVPYALVGWLWYLGTLVPMIGLVQVGRQSMADRYTYIPTIGLGILAAWGVRALAQRFHFTKALPVISIALAILWTGLANRQTTHWRNGVALFSRAINVTGGSDMLMRNNYGVALFEAGQPDLAAEQFLEALRLAPKDDMLKMNVDLLSDYRRDILDDSVQKSQAYTNLSQVYGAMGKFEEAIKTSTEALALDPKDYRALANRGTALFQLGKKEEGIRDLKESVRIAPDYGLAHSNLGWAYMAEKQNDLAIEAFKNAIQVTPDNTEAYRGLAETYTLKKEYGKAAEAYKASLKVVYDPYIEKALRDLPE